MKLIMGLLRWPPLSTSSFSSCSSFSLLMLMKKCEDGSSLLASCQSSTTSPSPPSHVVLEVVWQVQCQGWDVMKWQEIGEVDEIGEIGEIGGLVRMGKVERRSEVLLE